MSSNEPLSARMARMLEANSRSDGVTINELLESTDGRGAYLVIIILALPFILPVSIPGVSTVFGLAIALLSLRLAFGRSPRLPNLIGNRRLSKEAQRKVLSGSVRILRWVERVVRPRHTPWMATRPARVVNALLMSFMGLLLALPFPPLPPLTNSLPCYSIILISASMMEEDGVTIWIAYAVAGGTVTYLLVMAELIEAVLARVWNFFQNRSAR